MLQVIGQQDRQVLTAAGSSVAVATAGRCSRRVKHATARLAGCDGDFKNMMASFDSNSSDDSFLTFGNDYASAGAGKSVSELVAEKDAQFQKGSHIFEHTQFTTIISNHQIADRLSKKFLY